jgi:hypothetical protein
VVEDVCSALLRRSRWWAEHGNPDARARWLPTACAVGRGLVSDGRGHGRRGTGILKR